MNQIENLELMRSLWDDIPERISLAGVSFDHGDHSTQQNIETLTLGDYSPFELVPEPDNQHDKNAIRVVWMNEFHLGYVPKFYSETLSKMLAQGRHIQAYNLKRHEHPSHKLLGASVELKEVKL